MCLADLTRQCGPQCSTRRAKAGIEAEAPPRPLRHEAAWYEELPTWAVEPRFLDVVTVRGAFRIRLDAAAVPISARVIWDLAEKKLYDGLLFHRVVPGFVVQGGDPRGDGWGAWLRAPGRAEPGAVRRLPGRDRDLRPWHRRQPALRHARSRRPPDRALHEPRRGGVGTWSYPPSRRRQDRAGQDPVNASPPLPPPTLLGTLDWSGLEPLAGWAEEATSYQPDASAIEQLRKVVGSYRVIAVLGTWCGDSEREIPRLHRVLEAVGGDRFSLWLIGVDRTKRVSDPGFPVGLLPDNVPELVPMVFLLDSSDNELGRVVETAERPLEQLLVEWLTPVEDWQAAAARRGHTARGMTAPTRRFS
jgi:hypothetical protein